MKDEKEKLSAWICPDCKEVSMHLGGFIKRECAKCDRNLLPESAYLIAKIFKGAF